MKTLQLFLAAALILGGSIFIGAGTAHSGTQLVSFSKKANYTNRVWHDGYWWIQEFTDGGDLIREYIDPVQI